MVILPGLSIKSVMDAAPAVAKEYEIFRDEFTVYVFDRRSELPGSYPVAQMASDTAAAMRALGLADVYLFGASQGGMIAMEIAADHPDLARELALGSTAAQMPPGRFEMLDRWIRLAESGDRVGLFLAFGEAIYPRAVFEQYRRALEMIARTVTDGELRRFITLAEGTRGFDILDRLGQIRCPVLAIGASDDAVVGCDAMPQIAARFGDRPDCGYYQYDGCGHAAFDVAPDYQERLYRFFMQDEPDRHRRGGQKMDRNHEIFLELRDGEWPFTGVDHDRMIVRAIVVDAEGFFYFVRAHRDDDFGCAELIETSGGGVEEGESLIGAIHRELKEELGAQVDVLCRIGVVSDYYNLIRRHNINNYYLCRVKGFGSKSLTRDEIEDFHLSTLRLSDQEAVREYERCACTPIGRLIANRELPILCRAKELLDAGL